MFLNSFVFLSYLFFNTIDFNLFVFQLEYFLIENEDYGLELLTIASNKGHNFSTYAIGLILLFGADDEFNAGIQLLNHLKSGALSSKSELLKCRSKFRKIALRSWGGSAFFDGVWPHCCFDNSHRFFNELEMRYDYLSPSCPFCLCDMEIDLLQ